MSNINTASRYALDFCPGLQVRGFHAEADILRALVAERDTLLAALRVTAKWVALQGEVPGCGPAAESMGCIIAAAIAKAGGNAP